MVRKSGYQSREKGHITEQPTKLNLNKTIKCTSAPIFFLLLVEFSWKLEKFGTLYIEKQKKNFSSGCTLFVLWTINSFGRTAILFDLKFTFKLDALTRHGHVTVKKPKINKQARCFSIKI